MVAAGPSRAGRHGGDSSGLIIGLSDSQAPTNESNIRRLLSLSRRVRQLFSGRRTVASFGPFPFWTRSDLLWFYQQGGGTQQPRRRTPRRSERCRGGRRSGTPVF